MEKLSVSSLRMLCSHEVHKLLQQGTGTKLVCVFTHYRYLVCHCAHPLVHLTQTVRHRSAFMGVTCTDMQKT